MLPGHSFLSGFFLFPSLCVAFILSVLLFSREELMASGSSCLYELLLLLLLSCFSHVRLCATPQTVAHRAPLSLRFSRQEHRSGLPFPSPVQESEKWEWSRSIVFDSVTPWTAAYQAPLTDHNFTIREGLVSSFNFDVKNAGEIWLAWLGSCVWS